MKVSQAQTILFISGQVAYNEKGQPAHAGDFAAQARTTYGALKAQVERQEGPSPTSSSLPPTSWIFATATIWPRSGRSFFGKKGPASTLVGVTALAQPGWLIEVEAIAVL